MSATTVPDTSHPAVLVDEPRFHAIARGVTNIVRRRLSEGATTKAAYAEAVDWVVWAQGTPRSDPRWIFETETCVATAQRAGVIAVTEYIAAKFKRPEADAT